MISWHIFYPSLGNLDTSAFGDDSDSFFSESFLLSTQALEEEAIKNNITESRRSPSPASPSSRETDQHQGIRKSFDIESNDEELSKLACSKPSPLRSSREEFQKPMALPRKASISGPIPDRSSSGRSYPTRSASSLTSKTGETFLSPSDILANAKSPPSRPKSSPQRTSGNGSRLLKRVLPSNGISHGASPKAPLPQLPHKASISMMMPPKCGPPIASKTTQRAPPKCTPAADLFGDDDDCFFESIADIEKLEMQYGEWLIKTANFKFKIICNYLFDYLSRF